MSIQFTRTCFIVKSIDIYEFVLFVFFNYTYAYVSTIQMFYIKNVL